MQKTVCITARKYEVVMKFIQ